MQRWFRAALIWCGASCLAPLALAAAPAPAGASGITLRVTPNSGLVSGQTLTVTGRGLGKPPAKGTAPWFVDECTAQVKGRMTPATDTPHCDITRAEAVRVSGNGSFTVHYRVTAGIVGDGYCGTPGHATCVIALSIATDAAAHRGTVVPITFRVGHPGTSGASSPTTTPSIGASTTSTSG